MKKGLAIMLIGFNMHSSFGQSPWGKRKGKRKEKGHILNFKY
jgi:hypothetical protein